MNWRIIMVLSIAFCLMTLSFTDLVESRGGGSRGGGGFSRGGGGFSRGGGGSFGSIRNSTVPSTRETSRPSWNDRESYNRPSQGIQSEPLPSRQPVQRDGLAGQEGLSDQKQALQNRAESLTPEQKNTLQNRSSQLTPDQKQQIKDRAENLTPVEKEQVRQKFENSGLKPEQLPTEEPNKDREEWREDWQEWRDQNREDWQDWYDEQYEDYWDHHWHSPWWYGYPVSSVSYSFYVNDDPPCHDKVLVRDNAGYTTYYYCNSVWYQPTYASGDVKYVLISPPAGAELATLPYSYVVTVNGEDYYVNNHAFYQKIIRNGQGLYVLVDAPPGAQVPTIPQYAVEIKHQNQTYYRFDKVFYQRQGDYFVVVANPGI